MHLCTSTYANVPSILESKIVHRAKVFAINPTWWRMTVTFDTAALYRGVPAESYFHRMLCMHFSDRLLQETGAQEVQKTRLELNTTPVCRTKLKTEQAMKKTVFLLLFFFFFEGTFHLLKLPSYHLNVGSHK